MTRARGMKGGALVCTFVGALLFTSLFVPPLIYVALVITAVYIIVGDSRAVFCLLLFLFPYATIFKPYYGAMSLFTAVELFAALKLMLLKRNVNGTTVCALLFFVSVASLVDLAVGSLIKIVAGVLLLAYFVSDFDEKDTHSYSFFFISGLLSSSVIALFKNSIPRLLSMYRGFDYVRIDGELIVRFSGLASDPNYYSIPVVLCLIMTVTSFLNKKEGRMKYLIISAVLIAFGMLTMSKSFYLVLAVTLVTLVLSSNMRQRAVWFVLAVMGLLLVVLVNPFGILDGIVGRFEDFDLTTGRTEVWGEYMKAIFGDPKIFFVGAGLNAPYVADKAAHNIIIESLHLTGVIGLLLIICTYATAISQKKLCFKRSLSNLMGYAAVFVMFMFLCGLTAYEFPFYMMISYMIYNTDFASGRSLI